jgi:PAS domain-containing protein
VEARVRNTAGASAVYVKEQMDGLSELVGSYAQRPATVAAIGAVLGLLLLAGLALLARAQQQVQDREERTRKILEATAEAFISMDAGGLVTAWNRQATETFGWSAAEAVGRPLPSWSSPSPPGTPTSGDAAAGWRPARGRC